MLREPGHRALRSELAAWDGYVSSALLETESIRACARYGERYATEARDWLLGMALLPVDKNVLDIAAGLQPSRLRTLDAIHLATALSVRDDVGLFLAYDDRLGSAAAASGLPVSWDA